MRSGLPPRWEDSYFRRQHHLVYLDFLNLAESRKDSDAPNCHWLSTPSCKVITPRLADAFRSGVSSHENVDDENLF